MKKRLLVLLLSSAALLSFASCGKKPAPTESPAQTDAPVSETTAAPEKPEEEAPFVEEEPAENKLDESAPIPGINREYELTEQVFEEENLKLMLPEGVTAVNEGRGENLGHITVTDEEDGWKLLFRPFNFGYDNIINNVRSNVIYDGHSIKEDWSQDVETTLDGFQARVWANNTRKGWLHPSNEGDAPGVDIVVDYGETLVGEWLGLNIRLEVLEPKEDSNIYHYLYNSKLRAVLNSFEAIRDAEYKEFTANGFSASFPPRWPVKSSESSIVANLQSRELKGGISVSLQYNPDVQHHVDSYEGGEVFDRSYNGTDWKGVIAPHVFEKEEGEPTTIYSMYLFAPFNEKMCADVHVSSNSWTVDDFRNFLDNEQFVDFMNSVKLDPDSWHQPGTAVVDGFLSDGGVIRSYSGTDENVEIPDAIGEYATVYIGSSAFQGNTTLKSVTIPEGVSEIQANAFMGCENLETVVLPETLNYIYQNAFRDCPKLRDVVLPENVVYVGTSAFNSSGAGTFAGSSAIYDNNCFSGATFEKISIPDGSDLSADRIFMSLVTAEVELPGDLEALGEGAFSGAQNITRLDLPESLRSIGESAFSNMSGLPYIRLPEGITEIPYNCFNSTTLDVLVIPSTVTKIGDYATYSGAYIILQNSNVEIGTGALNADYIYFADAKNFVFPSDHETVRGSRLYLEGIYDPSQIQGDFYNGTSIDNQVYLPSDSTEEECAAMDSFLLSVGCQDIAWIGSAMNFMPEDTYGFDSENATLTGYHGESRKLVIPDYILYEDDGWWLTKNIYSIADGAFKDCDFTSAFFRGNCADGTGARILEGNDELSDIWFTTQLLFDEGNYDAEAFAGIPENVTVHLPESMTDEQKTWCQDYLHSVGVPESAVFEYYSFRE